MPQDREPPVVEWMERMRTAFMNAITEDDMRELAKNLMRRAKSGDREALRLVLAYTVPVPPQPTQHLRLSAQVQPRKALPNGKGRPPVVEVQRLDDDG